MGPAFAIRCMKKGPTYHYPYYICLLQILYKLIPNALEL